MFFYAIFLAQLVLERQFFLINRQTSILREFVAKNYTEQYQPTSRPFTAVNAVEIDGAEKHLVVVLLCNCSCKRLVLSMRQN